MEDTRKKAIFSICITNLADYNSGLLNYEWVDLPTSSEQLAKVCDKLSNGDRDELFLSDYESGVNSKLGGFLREYSDIKLINAVAKILDNCCNIDVIAAYADRFGNYNSGLVELANIALQEDEICFCSYSYDLPSWWEEHEKLGWTLAEENGLLEKLEEQNIECYFDFEKYGRDATYDGITAIEDGYFYDSHINENFFNYDDILEEAENL